MALKDWKKISGAEHPTWVLKTDDDFEPIQLEIYKWNASKNSEINYTVFLGIGWFGYERWISLASFKHKKDAYKFAIKYMKTHGLENYWKEM
jgi:hypothetical protein